MASMRTCTTCNQKYETGFIGMVGVPTMQHAKSRERHRRSSNSLCFVSMETRWMRTLLSVDRASARPGPISVRAIQVHSFASSVWSFSLNQLQRRKEIFMRAKERTRESDNNQDERSLSTPSHQRRRVRDVGPHDR